ncbi:hypothetical protein WJX74_007878 [Apatococcus lobatus]|uniref:Tr-type G domain-containing protein n=2 Tax=Apatococcus TaxID=904362 RepID=A0AAW1QMX0_9CHLO
MPGGKGGGGLYAENDYDDEEYDDFMDYGDQYDQYDDPAAAPQQTAKPSVKSLAGPKSKATQPAAAAAKKKQQVSVIYPNAPPLASPQADPVQPFGFDTPSPDDKVLQQQQRKGGSHQLSNDSTAASDRSARAGAGAAGTASAASPSNGLSTSEQGQKAARATPVNAAAAELDSMRLNSHAEATTSGAPPAATPSKLGRPLQEFRLEPDLLRMCEEADRTGQEGGGGSKPRLHLVILGHVDAGKSTLMGRLLHDLGLVDQKQVHRSKQAAAQAGKGSFAWAWLLDERPEERARGVTVDVAVSRFETAQRAVTLLDAPGHRDFVPNMIAGAAQADCALLLVDGSPGGFEAGFDSSAASTGFGMAASSGQTREHAQLARSLGIEQMAVVISKLDTCGFSQARFEEIKAILLPFLRQTGFRESSLRWLPAVGPTGQNLVGPPTEPALASWFQGPSVADAIDSFQAADRDIHKPLRMPIVEVFKSSRGALCISGKVEAGVMKIGSSVVVIPGYEAGTVKTLEADQQVVQLARAGDRVDVTLADVNTSMLTAGAVLCHPDWPIPLVTRVEARVLVLDVEVPILRGQQVILHAHAAREQGHVSALISLLDAKTGQVAKQRPRALGKGQTGVLEVTAARTFAVEQYSDFRAQGRIALRDGGRTLAVGIVTGLPCLLP